MITALIPAITAIVGKVVDKAVPDKDEADKLKAQLTFQVLQLNESELKSATSIIVAEAQGESWLQRSWRPITMLVFVGLVVAHWLGFTAPNISDKIVSDLLTIVQVGLGGYVLGRSGEKIVKEWKK